MLVSGCAWKNQNNVKQEAVNNTWENKVGSNSSTTNDKNNIDTFSKFISNTNIDDWQQYHDKDLTFSIKIPKGWKWSDNKGYDEKMENRIKNGVYFSDEEVVFNEIGSVSAPIFVGMIKGVGERSLKSYDDSWKKDEDTNISLDNGLMAHKMVYSDTQGTFEGSSAGRVTLFYFDKVGLYVEAIKRPGNRELNYNLDSILEGVIKSFSVE